MTAAVPLSPLADLLGVRCVEDPERLRRYEIPERGEPGHARALLLPDAEAEVGEVLAAATAACIPLVISAGRTGLVEAQRPDGEVVLSLERLDQALRFTLADGRAFAFTRAAPAAQADALAAWWRALGAPSCAGASLEVEAGIAVDAANLILEPLGLMWPMEMGSSSAASVGACIANASAGANAVCYGTAAHLAIEARGYAASGAPLASRAPGWQAVAPERLAINSAAPDPALGLIGTQGVLGVITRASLRAYPIPAQREAALIPVADMPAAMRVLGAARAEFGGDVEEFEFISGAAMDLVRTLKGEGFRSPLGVLAAPYFLLLQVKAHGDADDLAGRLYGFLAETLALPEERIGYAPLKALKEIRHSITEASNAAMRGRGGGRLSFDTATPVSVFGDYLAELERQLGDEFPGSTLIAFGHAGVGGAHLHVLGSREQPVAARAAPIVQTVFDVTQRFGGTFSAEHGVGSKWGGEFLARSPAATIESLLRAKRAHDPAGILNPRCFGLDRLAGGSR